LAYCPVVDKDADEDDDAINNEKCRFLASVTRDAGQFAE
jgi:hypothetical protein